MDVAGGHDIGGARGVLEEERHLPEVVAWCEIGEGRVALARLGGSVEQHVEGTASLGPLLDDLLALGERPFPGRLDHAVDLAVGEVRKERTLFQRLRRVHGVSTFLGRYTISEPGALVAPTRR